MKTLQSVSPYRVTYRVWDTIEDYVVFETKDKEELFAIYRSSFTARKFFESKSNYWFPNDWDIVYRYIIKTEFGDEIPYDDLAKEFSHYRCWWRDNLPEYTGPDVRYKQGNPNKIKRGYGYWGYWWDENPPTHYEFPYIVYGMHRQIQTQNEKRQNACAVADYGAEVVRGARRSRNLPDAHDDPMNSTQDMLKSWKHHSKRRKQWKMKE